MDESLYRLVVAVSNMAAQAAVAKGAPLFHGTAANWEAIQSSGLRPRGGRGADAWLQEKTGSLPPKWDSGGRTRSVYLSVNEQEAETFALYASKANNNARPYVYTIEVPPGAREQLRIDRAMPEAFEFPGVIPPAWIKAHAEITGAALAAAKRRMPKAPLHGDN